VSCSRWKALAFTPVLILLAAVAPAVRAQAPGTSAMSVCQARRTIVAELQRVYVCHSCMLKSQPSGIAFNVGELEFQAEAEQYKKIFPPGNYHRIDLKTLGEVTATAEGYSSLRIDGKDPFKQTPIRARPDLSGGTILGFLRWYSENQDAAYWYENARAFARAMNSLRLFARSYDSSRDLPPVCFADKETQTLFWREFQKRAAAWRALPTRPPISDEVRQYRLLAEDALNQKQFENAAAAYEAGLEIDPLWPQGHFNAAVIYGELKDYEDAVWHMRCYLELLPNAPDAQDARDQMLLWQGKLKQQAAAQ
jgi:tetratricopeptide (TPR) repeat protein